LYNPAVETGRQGFDGGSGYAPVTVYMARRIARERKMAGGAGPARLPVAPEVFELLVDWCRLKGRFEAFVGASTLEAAASAPDVVLYDGIEVFPSENARMPWRIQSALLVGP
jgi:hypothetical protein